MTEIKLFWQTLWWHEQINWFQHIKKQFISSILDSFPSPANLSCNLACDLGLLFPCLHQRTNKQNFQNLVFIFQAYLVSCTWKPPPEVSIINAWRSPLYSISILMPKEKILEQRERKTKTELMSPGKDYQNRTLVLLFQLTTWNLLSKTQNRCNFQPIEIFTCSNIKQNISTISTMMHQEGAQVSCCKVILLACTLKLKGAFFSPGTPIL